MSLSFTNLHYFKSNPKSKLDPDEQIRQFIVQIKGEIKENWKVIAPTPNTRVIYFELEGAVNKPELVSGSQFEARNEMVGSKLTKQNKKQ